MQTIQYGVLTKHKAEGTKAAYAAMLEVTYATLHEAIAEAYQCSSSHKFELLSIFQINLDTGHIEQVINAHELDLAVDAYYHDHVKTDEEAAESACLEAYNFRNDATL